MALLLTVKVGGDDETATVCAEPMASPISAVAAVIPRKRFLHLGGPTVHAPFRCQRGDWDCRGRRRDRHLFLTAAV